MDGAITPFVLPYEVRLCNFHGAGEGGEESGSAISVAITEGLAVRSERSLSRITNIEVTNEETHTIRVRRPTGLGSAKPLAELSQGAFRLVVKVDDRALAIH